METKQPNAADQKPKKKAGFVKIAILSRIDWPLKHSKSLLALAFAFFHEEQAELAVISGGLVSERDFKKLVYEKTEIEYVQQQSVRQDEIRRGVPKKEWVPLESKSEIKTCIEKSLIESGVRELAEFIPPMLRSNGQKSKIYVINAPAPSYDGKLGVLIARQLHELRPDIIPWADGDGRMPIKFSKRIIESGDDIGFVHAYKAVWHNTNDSSSPDRIVADKEQQTTQSDLPGLWISGCNGVSYMRPAGELSRARVSPPACHKIEHVDSSENQIGAMVIEVSPGPIIQPIRTSVSFRDEIAAARKLIPMPQGASEREQAILERIKILPSTIGMLAHSLPWSEQAIRRHLEEYMRKEHAPKIILDPISGKYDIDALYLRHEYHYGIPDYAKFKSDALFAFGCLHAGYPWTQYEYFVNQVPKYILEHDINILVGAGDYIAGMKHALQLRGEVIFGLNYTEQEELAAILITAVLFQVFSKRFTDKLHSKNWNTMITGKRVGDLVDATLPEYRYAQGNHDKWESDLGVTPLAHFHGYLTTLLTQAIYGYLCKKKFPVDFDVSTIVRNHIIFSERHVLPSGVQMSIRHPEMARTIASSGRAQGTLGYERDSNLVIIANFHTATEVDRWNANLGERPAIQVGTFAKETDFEKGKNKRCDIGGAAIEVWSDNGRIKKIRSSFPGPTHRECVRINDKAVSYHAFIEKLAVSFSSYVPTLIP